MEKYKKYVGKCYKNSSVTSSPGRFNYAYKIIELVTSEDDWSDDPLEFKLLFNNQKSCYTKVSAVIRDINKSKEKDTEIPESEFYLSMVV